MSESRPSSFPISLRPLQKEDAKSELLHDLIYRIHIERKGIRNVTEEQLEEEIREEEHGLLQDEDVDSEDEAKEDEEKGTAKFFAKKRLEMTKNLHAAIQESATLLDTLSLLGSKYGSSAHKTMSPALKQTITPSVFSYDKGQIKPDLKKHQDEAMVAAGSTMEALTSSAEALLMAATRLEEDVKRETQYWDQVLSLHKKGWPVYKPPGDKITTVVQFSATESGNLFKGRGIAALRANKNGTIKLDQRLSVKPKAIRLRFLRHGITQTTSTVSSRIGLPDGDASLDLEQIVRRAQDSLFDEELHHELLMEARTLQPLGVTFRENVIHIPTSIGGGGVTGDMWLIDLVLVENLLEQQISSDDNIQLVATSLRLLLSHLYHLRARRRTQKPPLADGSRSAEAPSILRPLMAAAQHYAAYEPFRAYLSHLSQTLHTAGYPVICELDRLPGVKNVLTTLSSLTPSKKQTSALHALMEQVNKPILTSMSLNTITSTPSIWPKDAVEQSEAEVLSFDLYTNLFDPTYRTEYVLRIPESLSVFIHGKEGQSSLFIPKTRFVFDSLDELKSYTCEIVAMDIMRSIVETGHKDWRLPEFLVPEIRRVTESNGKKVEIAIGIEIESGKIDAYMKWVSDQKEVRRESWGAEKRPGRLADVLESWITEHSVQSTSGQGLEE